MEGRRVGRKGRKGREEKEGQGETMEDSDGKEAVEREERELVKLEAPGLLVPFPGSHPGSCESRNPIAAVLPECCCLSLGRRREAGQTFRRGRFNSLSSGGCRGEP